MADEYRLYVGIDWGSAEHVICVSDGQKVRAERKVKHEARAIGALADWLADLAEGDLQTLAIAIELPHGPIVETLIERGFAVFFLNPKQLDRFRDRFSASGAKDDRRDALVLADSLRTDRRAFHRVQLDHPLVIQLRSLLRLRDDLERQHRRLCNQLWAQLHRFWPALLGLSTGADEPWLWDLLKLAPTPGKARRLQRATLVELLKRRQIRRFTADDLLAVLRQPALQVAPGVAEAAREFSNFLLLQLVLLNEQEKRCVKKIEAVLDQLAATQEDVEGREHRDVDILRSVTGVGTLVSAAMLAWASQVLARRDYEALRIHCGTAPVTRQSGKERKITMRYACNKRLRDAVYYWAFSAMQRDPNIRARYLAKRQKLSHGAALRSIADSLLRILIAMLRDGTLYDPQRIRRSEAPADIAA